MLTAVYAQPRVLKHVTTHYKRIFPEVLGYNYLKNATDITEILLAKYVGNKSLSESFEGLSRVFVIFSTRCYNNKILSDALSLSCSVHIL